MTISVGNGVIRAGRVRRYFQDPDIYPQGTDLLVQFKQKSGPPGLGVRLQLALPVQFGLKRRQRWDSFFEFDASSDEVADDEVADDWDPTRIDYPDVVLNSGAPIRAVVFVTTVADEDRSFRLLVGPADKP